MITKTARAKPRQVKNGISTRKVAVENHALPVVGRGTTTPPVLVAGSAAPRAPSPFFLSFVTGICAQVALHRQSDFQSREVALRKMQALAELLWNALEWCAVTVMGWSSTAWTTHLTEMGSSR